MNSLVGNSATSLENIAAELGDPVLEKLSNAGITSVESLADMTPEELEAIPGIGPETVERISVAVNNYFSTLESAGQLASAELGEVEYASDPLLAIEPDFPPEAAPAEAEASEAEPPEAEPSEELAGEQSGAAAEAAQDSGAAVEQDSGAAAGHEVENAPPEGADELPTHDEHPGEQDIDPANK